MRIAQCMMIHTDEHFSSKLLESQPMPAMHRDEWMMRGNKLSKGKINRTWPRQLIMLSSVLAFCPKQKKIFISKYTNHAGFPLRSQ